MAAKTGIVCTDCGVRKIDRTTDAADSHLCTPCFDYAGWENTHSDSGHDDPEGSDTTYLANEMEICPVCNPELDPRNVKIRTGHTNTVAKTRTSHTGHSHDVTPKARAACRKSMAAGHGPLQADDPKNR